MKILERIYYVVSRSPNSFSKDIRVYVVKDNMIKLWFEIEWADLHTDDEGEIQTWLDNNGYEDNEYEMIKL